MSNLAAFKTPTWEWTKPKDEAAQMVADGELTYKAISEKLKVHKDTIRNWMKCSEFAQRVSRIRSETESLILARGVADKVKRVEAANDRWNRMKLVISERAADPEMQNVPGGKSGLLIKDIKQVVQKRIESVEGSNQPRIHYSKVDIATYAVDTGILSEMRKLEEHVAKQTGQWVDKHDISAPGFMPTDGRQSDIDLSKLPPDQLENILSIMEIAKPEELD